MCVCTVYFFDHGMDLGRSVLTHIIYASSIASVSEFPAPAASAAPWRGPEALVPHKASPTLHGGLVCWEEWGGGTTAGGQGLHHETSARRPGPG